MSTSVTPGSAASARERSGAEARPPKAQDGPPGEWPPGDGASGGGQPPERDGGGRRLGPLGVVVIGLVAVVFAAGWAVIYARAGGGTPGIAAQTITFDIRGDTSTQVRYSVAKGEDDVVRCTVDAFDERFAIVGESRITVPAGVSKITRTDTLRTSKRATGARVKDCHKV